MSDSDSRNIRGTYRLGDPVAHGVYSFAQAMAAQPPAGQPPLKEARVEELSAAEKRAFAAFPPAQADARKVTERELKAVWVIHGMGQQMPFETLDQLANGLMDACERDGHSRPVALVREAKLGDQILQRVEFSLPPHTTPGGKKVETEVHLYEAYWAPVTEGVVKLRDVMSFLWNGATRGLMNWRMQFQRAMFKEMVPFRLTWRTGFYTATALLVLVALMVINAVILASGAGKVFDGNASFSIPAAAFGPLTTLASIVSAVAITFGVVLFLAMLAGSVPSTPAPSQPNTASAKKNAAAADGQQTPGFWMASLRNLSWVAFSGTVATIIVGAVGMAWILIESFCSSTHQFWLPGLNTPGIQPFLNACVLAGILLAIIAKAAHSWRRNRANTSEGLSFLDVLFYAAIVLFILASAGSVWLLLAPANFLTDVFTSKRLSSAFWIWPFLALISYVVRDLMIEYVGDVAAYVTPNKLDTFSEVRAKIKDIAYQSASAVYLARADDGKPLYRKVAMVGHSLGSVIAYDTLNRLINEDLLTGQAVGIIQQTGLLLTFGSPLDKIAFFFTAIGKNVRHIREQLASVVQPLIQDYDYRPFKWINVFSRNDIVCGSLDFYDFPSAEELSPNRFCPTNDQECIQRITNLQASRNPVENVPDEEALTPLVAHVQYWTDKILWDRLYEKLRDSDV